MSPTHNIIEAEKNSRYQQKSQPPNFKTLLMFGRISATAVGSVGFIRNFRLQKRWLSISKSSVGK